LSFDEDEIAQLAMIEEMVVDPTTLDEDDERVTVNVVTLMERQNPSV